jgi:hypothetical protein
MFEDEFLCSYEGKNFPTVTDLKYQDAFMLSPKIKLREPEVSSSTTD